MNVHVPSLYPFWDALPLNVRCDLDRAQKFLFMTHHINMIIIGACTFTLSIVKCFMITPLNRKKNLKTKLIFFLAISVVKK